jgi:hypothetical protein
MHSRGILFSIVPSAILFFACSSDDTTSGGAPRPDSGAKDSGASGQDSGQAGQDSGPVDSSSPVDSGGTADSASPTDSGQGDDAGDAGGACAAYCSCMQTDCPGVTVPGGATCQAACAAQTTWDLACRTTHCGYAGVNNPTSDHCKHAIGLLGVCQ